MKLALGLFGLFGALSALIGSLQVHRATTIVISGDYLGHVQPCGCTSPQRGGLLRLATLVHRLEATSDVVLLSTGALSGDIKRQDALKLETTAQILGALKVAAVNLTPEDAKLGLGALQSIQNQTGGKLLTSSVQGNGPVTFAQTETTDGLTIGGVSTQPDLLARNVLRQANSVEAATEFLVTSAKESESSPVLLLDGPKERAEAIAKQFPKLALIVYRSASDPETDAETVGSTLLVTPGQQGKFALTITLEDGKLGNYSAVPLDPEFPNDAQASRYFRAYLSEVDREGLLDKAVRQASKAFAGSQSCAKCHAADTKIWQHSKHSVALQSLEKVGEARDPECVKCHVTGLNLNTGFRSIKATPGLANVSCESCHGNAVLHSLQPKKVKLPKVQLKMCTNCHTADQSPKFNPLTYWAKIQHK